MSTNDRDPAAGIAAQCAGNRYDNKQWRQVNGRIYAGIHFVDPAHHSSRNEALLCLPDSEEGRGRSRKRNATAPFAQRIRELLFAISEIGHTFVVHGFGPVVIFIGEDVHPTQTTVGEFSKIQKILVPFNSCMAFLCFFELSDSHHKTKAKHFHQYVSTHGVAGQR